MRSHHSDYFAVGILLCIIGIFFFRLFFPVAQLIVTPDFGRSDAWHFSFATKAALSESLNKGELPLWRKDIGDGFPLLAEGQTGTYFLPNLILFSTLPAPLAYNIAILLTFAMIAIGTYTVSRILGLSVLSSLFSGITFTFSGLPMLQIPHISLLQGMSVLPWIFIFTILLTRGGMFPWVTLLSLSITQQIFTGFPQATLLTLILAGIYILWHAYIHKSGRAIIFFTISVLFGIGGAAAQILPSWEFLRASTFPSGFDFMSATQYSMPLKHLLTFLNPFALGNPKYGTYPPFTVFDGSIFWENTAYIGILPLVYICIGWLFQKKHSTYVYFFTCILLGGLLMAWGKYSPLYLFYTFWPLNLFRVPSRFLWLSAFAATMLATYGFDYVVKNHTSLKMRSLLYISLILTCIELTSMWWNYHLMVPVSTLLSRDSLPPYIATKKIFTIGESGAHNIIYIPHGWQNPKDIISLYTHAFAPDANILFGVNQHDIYAGRFLYRSSMADAILANTMQFGTSMATISSTRMLDVLGIQTVISYLPVDTVLPLKASDATQHIYENMKAVDRAYLIRTATTAATVDEAARIFTDPMFIPGNSAIVETRDVAKYPALATFTHTESTSQPTKPVIITKDEPNKVELRTDAGDTPALLILTDTFYPGWIARIDGVESRIYPTNVKQRAIIVPEGIHNISFTYEPKSVSIGLEISICIEVIVIFLMVAPLGDLWPGTEKITHRLVSDRRHSLDT